MAETSEIAVPSKNRVLRSSLTITVFTLLTGVFGYLSLVVLALGFGAQKEMDAYFSASTIPLLLTSVVFVSLSNTFIPLFVEIRQQDEPKAWKFASATSNALFLLLCGTAAVGLLFSNNIIRLFNPGFTRETAALSASIFEILLLALIFSGTSLILTSIFYSRHKFFAPSFALALSGFLTLLFVLGFRNSLGIRSIAFGTLAGSVCQFLILVPVLLRKGRYSLETNPVRAEIGRLARLALPLMAAALFYKSNSLVERFMASRLGEGQISYLGYAFKVISALVVLMTQGVSTVLFPQMSEYSAKRDIESLKAILSKGLRALLIIAVPAVFLILSARYELVRIVFERGDFTSAATRAVGDALKAYLGYFFVGVIGLPLVNILYSLKETAKVARVGFLSFLFYAFLAFWLSGFLGYLGIALASSVQYLVNLLIFGFIIGRLVGNWVTKSLGACLVRTALASTGACLAAVAVWKPLQSFGGRNLGLVLACAAGGSLYIVFLKFLRAGELEFIPLPILGRRPGRGSRSGESPDC